MDLDKRKELVDKYSEDFDKEKPKMIKNLLDFIKGSLLSNKKYNKQLKDSPKDETIMEFKRNNLQELTTADLLLGLITKINDKYDKAMLEYLMSDLFNYSQLLEIFKAILIKKYHIKIGNWKKELGDWEKDEEK